MTSWSRILTAFLSARFARASWKRCGTEVADRGCQPSGVQKPPFGATTAMIG